MSPYMAWWFLGSAIMNNKIQCREYKLDLTTILKYKVNVANSNSTCKYTWSLNSPFLPLNSSNLDLLLNLFTSLYAQQFWMLPNCYSKLHQHLQLSMHTLLQKDLSIKRRLASMYESVLRSVRCKLMKFRLKKLSFNYNRNWHTLLIHLTGCFKFIAILWLKTCVHTGHVQIESTCISVGFFFCISHYCHLFS